MSRVLDAQSLGMSILSAIFWISDYCMRRDFFSVSTGDACSELHVRSRSNIDETLANRNDVRDFKMASGGKSLHVLQDSNRLLYSAVLIWRCYFDFQEVKTSILSEQSACFLFNIMNFAFILTGDLGRNNKRYEGGYARLGSAPARNYRGCMI